MVDRLGNHALLAKGVNRELGNAPYLVKKAAYAASSYGVTRKIADDNAEWTPERLAARQQWMAHQATAIWRVDQLG